MKRTKRMIFVGTIGLLLLIIFWVLPFRIHQVSGRSMETAYKNGQVVLVNQWATIDRYDAVSFTDAEDTNKMYIKRAIGLPNDELVLTGNRLVLNFGESGFLTTYSTIVSDEVAHQLKELNRIPENSYFFVGDNVDFSFDSRQMGLISEEAINGGVTMIIW